MVKWFLFRFANSQLETSYKEFEGIATMQNADFPAKVLRGILEVGDWSFSIIHN